jgi:LCP family protein required for cell wall assembly
MEQQKQLDESSHMSHRISIHVLQAVLLVLLVGLVSAPLAGAQSATPVVAPPVVPTAAATIPASGPGPNQLHRTENFLVLGADVRPGPWMMHTDSIMLVALDHDTQQVGVLSIPRDLWVDIPGWGADRINAAYFAGDYKKFKGGGPALAKQVVEQTLGVPIAHVVLIKMDALEQLVTALGGITVNLDCPLYEQTPDPKNPDRLVNWTLPAGEVKLNGADARKFATYRYLTSDFGRTQRQQQLIWAIRNRAKSLDIVPRIPQLWSALSGVFKTDLNVLDVIRLSQLGLSLEPGNVHGAALDRDVLKPYVTKGGASVLVIKDKESLNKRLGEVFTSRPLAELGKTNGKCPAPPPGFKAPTPAPTSAP